MTETNIDALLERYLGLLDDYTNLQAKLASLHSGVYQNLAKANFSAERGIRYGQDYFDDRMHASRTVSISRQDPASPSASPVFRISTDVAEGSSSPEAGGTPEAAGAENRAPGEAEGADAGAQKLPKKSNDPLRWFGILTPLSLRQAQKLAIESVEEIVPRLATVSAEMAGIELEIRRGRKRRAKAEAVSEKEKTRQQGNQMDEANRGGVAV